MTLARTPSGAWRVAKGDEAETAGEPAGGFGAALRALRAERRLSANRLAALAGLDPSAVGRLERSERCPLRGTVVALADAMYCGRAEKDALLAAAGFVGVEARDPLAGEPELAGALAVLVDPAVSQARKEWLRKMVRGITEGASG